MKRLTVLSFIIGLLVVPIQAQAEEFEGLQKLQALERQQQVGRTLSNIAKMKHQMMLEVLRHLPPEPEQNAAPPTQYYAAPPTQYSDPRVELQRRGEITRSLIDFNRRQTQNTIDWIRSK